MGALHLSKLFGIQKNLGENGITPMKQLICFMEFVLSVAYLQYAFSNAFELFLKTIGIYFKKKYISILVFLFQYCAYNVKQRCRQFYFVGK